MAIHLEEKSGSVAECRREGLATGRVGARDEAERLLPKLAHLTPEDEALCRGVFENGMTPAQLARLTGLHRSTVANRVKRISRRMRSPEFAFVLATRDAWDEERRRVATARFLEGRPLRETARVTGVSVFRVRRHCDAILAQFEHSRL
ncbi:MAG: hypothetical protein ACF8PN_05290 [Phycisphaerales bacterium]